MTEVWRGAFGDVGWQRLADANVIGVVAGQGDRILAANDYFLQLVGYTREEMHRGAIDWRALTPPEWQPVDDRAYAQALTEGLTHAYEKEYLRRDGRRVPVLLGGAVVDAGPPIRYVAFVVDLSAQKAAESGREEALSAERAQRSRLEVLQRLTAALARASDSTEVAATVVSTVTAGLGAQAASISVFEEPGRFRLLAGTGLPEEFVGPYTTGVSVKAVPIPADVLRTGKPVLIASLADLQDRYPFYAGRGLGPVAWANLPLLVDGGVVGLAAFGWDEPRKFSPREVAFLEAVAGQCAAALHRARLLDRERAARAVAEAARERLALLARASDAFAHARDETELLAALAEVLEAMNAWVTVLVLDEQDRLVRTQVRLPDPEQQDLAADLVDRVLGPLPFDDPRAVVLRTARATQLQGTDAGSMLAAGDPKLATRLAEHELRHLAALPLTARDRVMGVVVLWRAIDQAPFTGGDLSLAGDVVNRAGTLLETLRILAARSWIAATLQASLLPEALPVVPGLELDARYVAAEAAAEVGGDFYDAFSLGAGEYALTIGDVSGRGVAAAGVTGLARSALHALSADLGPAEALARLNTVLLERTGAEGFLTAAYARVRRDADGAQVTLCSAGHPPPLLLGADGTATPVGTPGPLLGQFTSVELPEQTLRLGPGDSLLLYTDGVIEAHGRDGLFGEDRLLSLVRENAGQPATVLVEAVQRAVLDYRTGGPDDLAVLAVRVQPANTSLRARA